MNYWRVTSQTISNISKALEVGLWGENRPRTLASLSEGDRLALYCSGRPRGFVTTATVTGPMFTGSGFIWMSDVYPYRIPISGDRIALSKPVHPNEVLRRLDQTAFQNAAPMKGVIALTQQEFATIEQLLREADRGIQSMRAESFEPAASGARKRGGRGRLP